MFSFFFFFCNSEVFTLQDILIDKCTFSARFSTRKKTASITSVLSCFEDEITIPGELIESGIRYDIRAISSKAFYGSTIKKIVIPSSIVSIHCFSFSKSLIRSIELSNAKIETIRHGAFANCSYISQIDLSKTKIDRISSNLFDYCYQLKEVILPYTVVEICEGAFRNTHLTNIKWPKNLEIIGKSAFSQCSKLTTLNFSECNILKEIRASAFSMCKGIVSVDLGNKIQKIGKFAFNGTDLENIAIPKTVNSIGRLAFSTVKPSKISISQENTKFYSKNNIIYSKDLKTIVYWPNTEKEELRITEGVKEIGKYSMMRIKTKNVKLPKSVKVIGSYAFSFSSFEAIELNEELESIGKYAFFECKGLKKIDLSKTKITSIKKECFYNCANLTAIKLPETLTEIEFKAFSLTNIEELYIPSLVSTIGVGFVAHCRSIRNITVANKNSHFKIFKDSLYTANYDSIILCPFGIEQNAYKLHSKTKSICPFAFAYSTMDVVYLSPKLERIEAFAFYNSFVVSIHFPVALVSIENHAFSYCEFLETVDFSNTNLKTIGEKAFEFCSKIDDIQLSRSLVSVGSRAFSNCASLRFVTYYGTKELRGDRVFENCDNNPEARVSTNYPVSTLAGLKVEEGTIING